MWISRRTWSNSCSRHGFLHCSQILTYTQDMLSLSNLKFDLIKILRVVGIFLAIIIILLIVLKIGTAIKEIVRPSPPTPPAAKFGKLPPVSFPQSVTSEKLTYQLDTLTGK